MARAWATAFEDDCSNPNVWAVWNSVDCGVPASSRVAWHADGGPEGRPWREFTVLPGDSLGWSGIRCEAPHNDRLEAPILLYEGTRARITFDLMLGESFGIDTDLWGGVCQLKQCEPFAEPCGVFPQMTLQGYYGELRFQTCDGFDWPHDRKLWTPPAPGEWTEVRIDGYFSQGPDAWTRMRVGGVASERVRAPNLLRACADYPGWPGGPPPILKGYSIPDHFRIGPYTHADRGEQGIGWSGVRLEVAA